jgi:hypothetical protein
VFWTGKKYFFILFLYSLISIPVCSQTDPVRQQDTISLSINNALIDTAKSSSACPSDLFSRKRFALIAFAEATLYAGSLIGLNELWYKNYPRSSFHFFDDNDEWLQMDKVGHITTSYYVGRVGIGLMRWTGIDDKKAIWYGGMLGSVYQSTIEIMDAYSSEWGFSAGDFIANTAGSFLCVGQELAWRDQRIVLKFSFLESKYSFFRPELLGSNLQEKILKDYNGQTYWLSVNPSSFMSKETKFPHWLNIAFGYGADGMTGGKFNPPYIDKTGQQIYFERYRQFYLSLDVDLTRIKTKSKLLKTVFYSIGFIKIPAPSIEFSRYGIKGSWLGF